MSGVERRTGKVMLKIVALAFWSSLAFSATARAGWEFVSKDDFSTIYMDQNSLKNIADATVSVSALTDYDPASPKARDFRLSEKGLSEIETVLLDCANRKYSSQGGAWRSGHMGSGETTKTYLPKEAWSNVPSFYAGLFAKVCAKG